jgi:cellulose 1,4-beta-cellobiosidase
MCPGENPLVPRLRAPARRTGWWASFSAAGIEEYFMHCSSAVPRLGTAARIAALLACTLASPPAQAESRVENPFAGADWYVSPEYAASVGSSMAQVSDAKLKNQMSFVASKPTAFWLDRIAAINGSSDRMGLAAHLDAALAQQKSGKPMVVITVIYDLPGRDCAALASNGELGPEDIGRYKTEYIDPIAAIEGNSKYSSLRIVNIIEVDSLPNLVTNVDGEGATDMCKKMQSNGNYVKGVQYALSKLYAAGTNTYNYIDAAHHGWIGWKDNFENSATLFRDTAKGATGGVDTVAGFITNTANYSALVEPFITLTEKMRSDSDWVSWNNYVDEKSFAIAFRNQLISINDGFKPSIGMLIDTSRNGWGGPARPTQAVTTGTINEQVDGSRVDRRLHAGNWCNQTGAGIGELPKVVGQDGIHAYVWVKPPGESDGSDTESGGGKGIDQMCDPKYEGNYRNGNSRTGAMSGAPLSGKWFHKQFVELVQNAYPAIPGDAVVPTPTPAPTPGPTPTPTPAPGIGDFQLTVSPSALTLNQGESGSATILIGKSGGFTGTVALTASGFPAGVTATFAPTSAGSESTLTVSASATAAPGSATITITGTSGSLSKTKTLDLTVNAANSPSFSLSASPSSITIDRGASGTSSITVQPSQGFSGNVSLSAENLPEGVTAEFSPQSASSSSTVTFRASSTAPAASATVTITGSSNSPSITKSTTVTVTVNASGGAAEFSLAASPATVTVKRGASATANIQVTALGGFKENVALSASGPSGISVAFSPTSTSSSSTASFSVASSTAVGSYEITIQGTSGSLSSSAKVWVIVTDSGNGGGTDGNGGGAAAGGCGCATTGPADAAIGSLTLLAAMMLWVRRRA